MASTGVCHSDLHVKNGCIPSWHFPAVLGHEGAGVIESVGEGVTSFKPGKIYLKFVLLSNYYKNVRNCFSLTALSMLKK